MNVETNASRPSLGRATCAASGATKTAKQRLGCVALGLLLTGLAATAQAQNAGVYTYHYDTLRTGWQQNETVLTTSNVGQLALLHTLTVNGRITAQPLVVPNQSVNGNGPRTVVYIVTDTNYLYAFDGDTGQKLGSTQFGSAVPESTLPGVVHCNENSAYVGITSTPVIDPKAGLIYLIADITKLTKRCIGCMRSACPRFRTR